jgi:hypothetical protein
MGTASGGDHPQGPRAGRDREETKRQEREDSEGTEEKKRRRESGNEE